MKSNDVVKEQNHTKTVTGKLAEFVKCRFIVETYIFVSLAFLIAVIISLLNSHINFDIIDAQKIRTHLLLSIILALSFLITLLFFMGNLISKAVRWKTQKKADLSGEAKEQTIAETKGSKIMSIILWIFYLCTFLTLLAYIIHNIVIIAMSI